MTERAEQGSGGGPVGEGGDDAGVPSGTRPPFWRDPAFRFVAFFAIYLVLIALAYPPVLEAYPDFFLS